MITWDPKDYARNSSQQQIWARELIAKLRLRGHERVLDIGCGDGKVTAEIASRVPRGEVVGLDNSRAMIGFAQQAFAQGVHANLSFVVGDASALPFVEKFDVVFSNAALHWVYDHRPVLAGIARSLRPGGRVLLQMGGAGNAAGMLRVMENAMREPRWRECFRGFAFRYGFHGPAEYRDWLRAAGLAPIRVELVPKRMEHDGADGLAGWLRTTWVPYVHAIPEGERPAFVREVVGRYLDEHPLTSEGKAVVGMSRLEIEATR